VNIVNSDSIGLFSTYIGLFFSKFTLFFIYKFGLSVHILQLNVIMVLRQWKLPAWRCNCPTYSPVSSWKL